MAGLSLSELLIREAHKLAERQSPGEMHVRLQQREPVKGFCR